MMQGFQKLHFVLHQFPLKITYPKDEQKDAERLMKFYGKSLKICITCLKAYNKQAMVVLKYAI